MERKFISDKNIIREMWTFHFESLGKLSVPDLTLTFANVSMIDLWILLPYLTGMLNEPLTYEEIVKVCSKLKSGFSGVVIDYEHIHRGEPSLWRLLLTLYEKFLDCHSVSSPLKSVVILRLFKGTGAKASNKEGQLQGNYSFSYYLQDIRNGPAQWT